MPAEQTHNPDRAELIRWTISVMLPMSWPDRWKVLAGIAQSCLPAAMAATEGHLDAARELVGGEIAELIEQMPDAAGPVKCRWHALALGLSGNRRHQDAGRRWFEAHPHEAAILDAELERLNSTTH
ncbi:hypothetical protein [Oceanibaculum indicum]|uniref:Uncharacterized protein n=1 Tax=Oceanibaculum indicum P24 TaxID=1207063 RepID=K2KDX8_9PROT|nr:hypothetical protein [Oceanibaculum indicum]EKE75515.1 hypothetical protein P24_09851 [Oceanibaculum indicum P24]